MSTIVTFGEVMLRLSPPGYTRFTQAASLELTFGGAEANVAVALAQLGLETRFVTVLPDNDLAQACINQLRGLGVDTRFIQRGGERMGIYFAEKGASQRPSSVIYDRAASAIARMDPSSFDWKAMLAGASWFHCTGITPALSEPAAAGTRLGLSAAKEAGLITSCDLNYRKKLWSRNEARRVMGELMPLVDYCIANEEDADDVFGIKAGSTDVTSATLDRGRYQDVARQLSERFDLAGVAITLRESLSASRNGWSGMLYTSGKAVFSRRYEIDIVDRVGGGDAFGAGLIYALVNGKDPASAIELASAASCLKHTIEGDYCLVKLSEVERLAGGDASGRVQR
ncbi:MAG: sugar kinase [Proteobacteria bacterium]|nr:sugar kinase [Pseudomonadota bacterium]